MIATMIAQAYSAVVFVVDEHLVCHHLGGVFILYAGFVFYEFAGIGYLVRYKRRISYEARVSGYIFVAVCSASVLIQFFYQGCCWRPLESQYPFCLSILRWKSRRN